MALETEASFFDSIRDELVRTHDGQYALIKGSTLEGVFSSFSEAYEAGVRAHGTDAFMVRQVRAEDTPVLSPALNAGILSAR